MVGVERSGSDNVQAFVIVSSECIFLSEVPFEAPVYMPK